MEKYFFMERVLQLVSEGHFFRRAIGVALKALAIAVGFAAMVGWLFNWKLIFSYELSGLVGGFIFQLLYVNTIYMVIHTLWIRARDIRMLPESEYTVVPIVSIGLKLLGELYASFVAVMSLAEGLFTAFAAQGAFPLFHGMAFLIPRHEDTLIGGFSAIMKGEIYAFVGLVFFYFLSESVIVAVDIARNVKK